MIRAFFVALAALALLPSSARAEIVASSPSAFELRAERLVAASPDQAWRALVHIGQWWDPLHSYSGEGRNLTLDARAGGCFCERWGRGQSVEHARVLMVMEQGGARTLRLAGALGPLQAMGVAAILTFTIAEDPNGAKLTMTYRVSGDPGLELNQLAPAVDGVLMGQFERLAALAEQNDRH